MLDDEAKQAYRRRLADLDAEIDESAQWNDSARTERATVEREALITELTAATGLGRAHPPAR